MKSTAPKASTDAPAIKTTLFAEKLRRLSETLVTPPATPTTRAAIVLKVLQTPALRSFAKKDKALAAELASIQSAITSTLKDAQTKQKANQSALAGMLQNAADLFKPLS